MPVTIYNIYINFRTKIGSTPLRAACFNGDLNLVRFLAQNGAEINFGNIYNNTCLMIAAYKGHHEIVRFLMENGANINMKGNTIYRLMICGFIILLQSF